MADLEHHEFHPPVPLPDSVPIARAVIASDIPFFEFPQTYTPPPQAQVFAMPMPPLRAFIELLIMVPVAIAGGVIAYLALGQVRHIDHRWVNVFSTVTMGTTVLLYISLILRMDKHRAVTIGWTVQHFWKNVGIGLGAYFMMSIYALIMAWIITQLFPSILTEEPAAQKAIQETFPPIEFLPMVLLMLFVAIWEEIAFRGFVLTRLQAMLKRWWLTVTLSSLIFGLIHAYEGILAVGLIAGMGFIMGGLFVWRRSLVPCIAFHFANNIIMMQVLRYISTDWKP